MLFLSFTESPSCNVFSFSGEELSWQDSRLLRRAELQLQLRIPPPEGTTWTLRSKHFRSQHMNGTITTTHNSSLLRLDATHILRRWIRAAKRPNFRRVKRIVVHAWNSNGEPLSCETGQQFSFPLQENTEPALLTFSRKRKTSLELNEILMQAVEERNARDESNGNRTKRSATLDLLRLRPPPRIRRCGLRNFSIQSSELAVPFYIFAPKTIDINYCEGSCRHPIPGQISSTTHSQLRSLLHEFSAKNTDLEGIGQPCCAPTKLISLTLLILNETARPPLWSVTTWSGVKVLRCGCR